MTTLAITPNWKNKTARFKGTVAAGEHVSVTIQNENGEGGEFIDEASNLRLRVVDPCNGKTLAIFPEPVPEGETPEEWDSDLSPLRCTLNLNTAQMLKAVPPAANVPLLFVLDAYREDDAETEAYEGEFTLYFKDFCEVTHWPRKFGEEEPAPTDLDDYANIIADFNTRLTAAEETAAAAAQNAQSAAASASAAASSASTAATAATDAQTGAIAAKNAAQSAADSAATAKTAAETAQGKAEDAQEAAETAQGKAEEAAAAAAESAAAFVVDDTLSVEGAAADAKAVGDANQNLITRIETVQDNLANEVAAREELDGAVQVDRQNLANEIARAQGAEQTLDANKADKATTYTKAEIDAKWAGFVDGAEYDSEEKKIILTHGEETIAEIDATDFIKDGMVSSVEIEDGKLVITFNTDSGLEPIEIPLTDIFDPANYYDKTAADGKFVAKEAGKGLSTEDYTTAEKTKLGGIAAGAQVNVIETVKVNGTALTPQDKAVNIPVPTLDNTVTPTSANGVKSSGIWSMLWGALTALPSGFTSLYDWCVAQFTKYLPLTGGTMTGPLSTPQVNVTRVGYSTWSMELDGDVGHFHFKAPRMGEGFGSVDLILPRISDNLSGTLALAASSATAGNLAALDANGNPVDSDIPAANVALKSAIPYDLGTPIVINAASSEVVEGETVYYGAATLANRTANIVQVTAATALDELRITFPAETSGKVRDFGLRVEIGTGSAALAAPALVPIAPTGETIKIENNAAEIPALADGTATAKGVTLLYFSETAPGVFVVKGEQVEEVQ